MKVLNFFVIALRKVIYDCFFWIKKYCNKTLNTKKTFKNDQKNLRCTRNITFAVTVNNILCQL